MYMNGMASDKLSFLKMVSDIKTDGKNHFGQSKEMLWRREEHWAVVAIKDGSLTLLLIYCDSHSFLNVYLFTNSHCFVYELCTLKAQQLESILSSWSFKL